MRRHGPWLVAGLIALAIAVDRARALAAAPPTDFDDAYMYLRYAHNLLRGHGISWNAGTPVYGPTSLLHLGVVVVAPRLEWASGGAALAALVALAALAARYGRGPGWAWLGGVPLLVAYTEPFWFHATSGMDTMLAVLANTALAAVTVHLLEHPTRRAALVAAGIAYLAVLARPDSGFYALFAPGLALAGDRKLLATFAAPLCALLAAHALCAWHFLGTPAPLGFYVKQPHAYGGFAGEYTWNPFLFLRVFLVAAAPFALVVIACGRRPAAILLAPVVATFVYLFWINQIMGHLGRFFYPALPFLVAAAAVSLSRPSRTRLALAGLSALVAWPVLGLAGRRYEARAATQPLAPLGAAAANPLPDLDSWQSAQEMARLAAAAPPGTRFAMSEHGLVAARAPDAIIIDVLGLHDRAFARGFSARELFARAPDVIWLPHPDHTQMVRDILDAPAFGERYVFYPEAFTFGVAVRQDAPALRALFCERFRETYGRSCDGAAATR